MAGVGVLALPKSMVGTGPAGFALLIYFTLNAMFSGSRLGLCWVMICERWEEYREGVREAGLTQQSSSILSPLPFLVPSSIHGHR